MATGTFYLRPCADISLGHAVYPSSLASGYLAINEEVADGSSTYLQASAGKDETTTTTSVFELGGELPKQINAVTDASVNIVIYTDNDLEITLEYDIVVSVDGTDISCDRISGDVLGGNVDAAEPTSYVNKSLAPLELKTLINNYISTNGKGSFPPLTLTISTIIKTTSSVKSGTSKNFTQAYLALDLEYVPDMVKKIDGVWKQIKGCRRKISGAWTTIDVDECKSLLSSNIVIDKCKGFGHNETALADIAATCTETGMTGGKYCTFCGKTTKEHDTVLSALGHNEVATATTATCTEDGMTGGIECSRCGVIIKEHDTVQSALGHDYNSVTGKCSRCTTYHPDSFTFTYLLSTSSSATTSYAMPNTTWSQWVAGQTGLYIYWKIGSDGSIIYDTSVLWGEGSTYAAKYIMDNAKSTDIIVAGQAYTLTKVE